MLETFLAQTDWPSDSFCCYKNTKKKRCRLLRRIWVSRGKKELVHEVNGLLLTLTGAWNRSGNTLVQSLNSWLILVEAFALQQNHKKTKLQHIFKEKKSPYSHELRMFRCSHTRTAPHGKVISDRYDGYFVGMIITALQFSELSLKQQIKKVRASLQDLVILLFYKHIWPKTCRFCICLLVLLP